MTTGGWGPAPGRPTCLPAAWGEGWRGSRGRQPCAQRRQRCLPGARAGVGPAAGGRAQRRQRCLPGPHFDLVNPDPGPQPCRRWHRLFVEMVRRHQRAAEAQAAGERAPAAEADAGVKLGRAPTRPADLPVY